MSTGEQRHDDTFENAVLTGGASRSLNMAVPEDASIVSIVGPSAVANAVNNDDQDADELYVVACFADEGPTLRRFRPRARGRATRINKRTCHITVTLEPIAAE